jgi:hypothetical protein
VKRGRRRDKRGAGAGVKSKTGRGTGNRRDDER